MRTRTSRTRSLNCGRRHPFRSIRQRARSRRGKSPKRWALCSMSFPNSTTPCRKRSEPTADSCHLPMRSARFTGPPTTANGARRVRPFDSMRHSLSKQRCFVTDFAPPRRFRCPEPREHFAPSLIRRCRSNSLLTNQRWVLRSTRTWLAPGR